MCHLIIVLVTLWGSIVCNFCNRVIYPLELSFFLWLLPVCCLEEVVLIYNIQQPQVIHIKKRVRWNIKILIFVSNYKNVIKINDLNIIKANQPSQGNLRPEKDKLEYNFFFLSEFTIFPRRQSYEFLGHTANSKAT